MYNRILFLFVLCSIPRIGVAGNVTLNWSHSANSALSSTSEYLDYVNWEALSTLYKEVHAQPPVNGAKPNPNQKTDEVTLSLFCLPQIPEARFWFWMSAEEKTKKQKIESCISDIKSLLSQPQENVCAKLLQKFADRGHASDLEKAMNIVTKLSSTLPSMQSTISELLCKKIRLDSIDFPERPALEKLLTSEEHKSRVEEEEFCFLASKITAASTLTEKENQRFLGHAKKLPEKKLFEVTLSTANVELMKEKKYADLVVAMVKNINSEDKIDLLLEHAKFLRLLPKASVEELLHRKLEYVREKFWEKKIAWIGKNLTTSVDKEAWIQEEKTLVENFKQNEARLSFVMNHFSELKAGQFSKLVSSFEEKEVIPSSVQSDASVKK